MKCPYCDKEMRAGYLQGGQGIIFAEKQKSVFLYKNPFDEKEIQITPLFYAATPAYYCDSCQCIIWKKSFNER